MGYVEAIDREWVNWVQELRTPWFDLLPYGLTWLGSRYVLTPVTLLPLRAARRWRLGRAAVLPLVALLASAATTELLKAQIQRPRPDVVNPGDHVAQTFSFPSGHSCSAAAVYGVLALLAAPRLPNRAQRAAAFAVAGSVIVLVGVTRIYLGVHYLSDVVAGWLLGLAWAVALARLDPARAPP